jgi:hypothetical protein
MSEPLRVAYRPRPGISPEQEAEILAAVYRLLLERHAQKATDENNPKPEGGADGILRKHSEE